MTPQKLWRLIEESKLDLLMGDWVIKTPDGRQLDLHDLYEIVSPGGYAKWREEQQEMYEKRQTRKQQIRKLRE